jgi:hypothetical protein
MEEDAEGDAAMDADEVEGEAFGVELAVELVLLLPQAATPAASAHTARARESNR